MYCAKTLSFVSAKFIHGKKNFIQHQLKSYYLSGKVYQFFGTGDDWFKVQLHHLVINW